MRVNRSGSPWQVSAYHRLAGVGVERQSRCLAHIGLGNSGPVVTHQEIGQQEDQRSHAHHNQSDGDEARLGGTTSSAVVGNWY